MLSLLQTRCFHVAMALHEFLYVPGNVAIQRSLQINFITSMTHMLQSEYKLYLFHLKSYVYTTLFGLTRDHHQMYQIHEEDLSNMQHLKGPVF